jgi:hypothetical protein
MVWRKKDHAREGRPANFHIEKEISQERVMFHCGLIGNGTKLPLTFIEGRMNGVAYLE